MVLPIFCFANINIFFSIEFFFPNFILFPMTMSFLPLPFSGTLDTPQNLKNLRKVMLICNPIPIPHPPFSLNI